MRSAFLLSVFVVCVRSLADGPASQPASVDEINAQEKLIQSLTVDLEDATGKFNDYIRSDPQYLVLKKNSENSLRALEKARESGSSQDKLDASSAYVHTKNIQTAAEKSAYQSVSILKDRFKAEAEKLRSLREARDHQISEAATELAKKQNDIPVTVTIQQLKVDFAKYAGRKISVQGRLIAINDDSEASATIGSVYKKAVQLTIGDRDGSVSTAFLDREELGDALSKIHQGDPVTISGEVVNILDRSIPGGIAEARAFRSGREFPTMNDRVVTAIEIHAISSPASSVP